MAYIDIGETRFTFRDYLSSLNIRESYGFVASAVQATIDQSGLSEMLVDYTRGRTVERESLRAVIDEPDRLVTLKGKLDTFGGQMVSGVEPTDNITLAGRSLMSVLTDSEPITRSWVNVDWSAVVREVVEEAGISTKKIESSGILAGEKIGEGQWLLSEDDKTPSEIIFDAVSATGFIASIIEDGSFVFAKEYVPSWYEPVGLKFSLNQQLSDISVIEFNDGGVERITIEGEIEHIPPGAPIQLIVEPSIELSGTYFVTESDYTVHRFASPVARGVYSISKELPKLGK